MATMGAYLCLPQPRARRPLGHTGATLETTARTDCDTQHEMIVSGGKKEKHSIVYNTRTY